MLNRLFVAALLALMGVALVAVPAQADPVTCPPGQVFNRALGICIIVATPDPPAPPSNPGGPSDPGESGGGVPPQECMWIDKEVPCRRGAQWWSDDWGCYIGVVTPQPPRSAAVWEGHTDGTIFSCYSPWIVGTKSFWFWAAAPPAGPAGPPDPEELAQQAVVAMRLKAVTVGITPQDRPGSVGIVGMPTWLWATNPGRNTWGPVTRSASAGGYTVTATAKVESVGWDMGDGTTVTCNSPGTPYHDNFGKQSSPDCGHTYTRQGRYTVTATSHWVVEWAGMGQSGSIPMDLSETATITLGEAQVLNQ